MAKQQHFLTPEELSLRILRQKSAIQIRWLNACKDKIAAAKSESYPYLSDSLPEVLERLAEVLGKYDDHHDYYEAMVLAKKHGEQRALSPHYTVKDLLTEYQILRELIFEIASVGGVIGVRTSNIVGNFIEGSLANSIDDFLRFSLKAPPTTKLESGLLENQVSSTAGTHH